MDISDGRRVSSVASTAMKACAAIALFVAGMLASDRWHQWHPRPLEISTKPRQPTACEVYLGSPVTSPFSVILTADPGDFSGTPEAHYIIANLKDKKMKPRDSTVCGGHYQGLLMGQPVLVVTTGIGPPAAGLCTQEVVTACGPSIREILYFGTSGWSPQLGGVLNPPACDAANTNGRINRLGDVCISPFTVNWTCKKSSWVQQAAGYPNQCYRPPEVASPNATVLYGMCQFYEDNMAANLKLADELAGILRSKSGQRQLPARSTTVTQVEQRYWSAMGNATGVQYPVPEPTAPPTIYDYTQCMEVDGQFFYSGVPFELKARDYASETLSAALGVHKTAEDIIAVGAMEGVGVAEALVKYHALSSTKHKIPYTHIRTLSNWLHQPVRQVSPGVWETAQDLPEDFVTGYSYAIATGSATLMSLYQRRCQDDVGAHRLPANTECKYVIDYTRMTSRQAAAAVAGAGVHMHAEQDQGSGLQAHATQAAAQRKLLTRTGMPLADTIA